MKLIIYAFIVYFLYGLAGGLISYGMSENVRYACLGAGAGLLFSLMFINIKIKETK